MSVQLNYLLFVLFIQVFVTKTQKQNLTCSKTEIIFNSKYCAVRNTNIIDINNVEFVELKSSMTALSINSGVLDSLPSKLFVKHPYITNFFFTNTLMKNLKAEDLEGAENLLQLFLTNTSFSRLKNNSFERASKLTNLFLYQGIISEVDVNAFQALTSLIELTLTNQMLETLANGVLDDLIALKIIYLNENKISSLPEGLFTKNLNLTVVQASKNQLKSLPPNLFLNNLKIDYALFNENLLEKVTTLRINSIDLSKNQLHQVYITKRTTNVLLMDNFVTKINCAKNLSLKYLYADNNGISSFRCIKNMKDLFSISLAHNNLTVVGKSAFKKLTSLTNLNLYGNKFKFLRPMVFAKAIKLQRLECDFLNNYQNLHQRHPYLSILRLNTKLWDCSKLDETNALLKSQKIYLLSNGCSN